MILTDYYRFERIATKSKYRLDCVASTGSYPAFEEKRATTETKATEKRDYTAKGALVVYLGDVPPTYGGDVHRKADKALTIKGQNLSSLYVPNPRRGFAYGDCKGTTDAILVALENLHTKDGRIEPGGAVEVFVARGQAANRAALYNLMCDGEFDEEMERLRVLAEWRPNVY